MILRSDSIDFDPYPSMILSRISTLTTLITFKAYVITFKTYVMTFKAYVITIKAYVIIFNFEVLHHHHHYKTQSL